ncbi:hypothetical protein N7474_010205 [Penicillium riverlandense]|uniref:uncharacterized protein n=1 Tax=Penicillium riverlandense TaxID=1903569 RepID=UPI002547FE36|nr:uncharacterized protein N7474_010205 [Penicillium riverlandense]KAJ5808936.1 hypothetical protein N7474_010205 [Penicillium riverlandense]
MPQKHKLDDQLSPSPKRRVLGPSLPPPSRSSTGSASDSDSDDDFGPSLPPPEGDLAPVEQHHQPDSSTVETGQKKTEQRDQWMLHPPEKSDWAAKIDPTQLRNRKFQTGRSARSGGPQAVDASWVENPEERMKRLQNEVMGVAAAPADRQPAPSKTSQSMEEKIKKYKDMTDKTSRLDSSATQTRKEDDDDPSMRAFDREKDMAVGSRISTAQRREMVNKAGGYTSRFTKGSFL